MTEGVKSRIHKIVSDFNELGFEILPGIQYSQRETLLRVEKYYAGKFLEGGERDNEGFHRFFYNVAAPRCDVATKAIDLDTKDLRVEASNRVKAWLFGKELKQWTRTHGVGKLLNQIVSKLPIYGSVVVKAVNKKVYLVDLKNLINDQSVESLEESDVIEKHEYTPTELRKQKWDKAAIESVIAKHAETNEPYIAVYESYLWIQESEAYEGGDPEKFVRYLCIAAGLHLDINRNLSKQSKELEIVKLYTQENPEFPYREVHWERIAGRWLARGIVEKLFDVQERVNEIVNRLAKVEHWASKQVFQTRDVILQKNLLTDAFDGDIIKVQSEITKVGVEDRNAPNMREDLQFWLLQADKLAFSYEIATGANLPSGTPFRLAFIQQQAVASYFDMKREEVGLFLRDLIIDLIIPEFKKDKKKVHQMIVGGSEEEVMMLRNALADALARDQIGNLFGRIETIEQLDEVVMKAKQTIGTKISLEIPDSYYKNLKETVDMIITGEQVDINTKTTTLTTAMQTLGANPMILQHPILRRIFARALDTSGEDSSELLAGAELMPPMQAPVAGSVAKQQPNELVTASRSMAI